MSLSSLSRHRIRSVGHGIVFVGHDLLIPCFLVMTSGLIWTSYRKKRYGAWHRRLGRACVRIVCPCLFTTGCLLASKSRTPLFFYAYGISFGALASDVSPGVRISETIRRIGHRTVSVLLFLATVHLVASQPSRLWTWELAAVTLPLVRIHWFPPTTHGEKGRALVFSGWMGTAFSLSQDRYWVFCQYPLPMILRWTIQQLPFAWWCLRPSDRNAIRGGMIP